MMGCRSPREGDNFWGFRPIEKHRGFAAVYAKTAEPIEMPFGVDICGPKESYIRWCRGSTGPLATARGDESAMRPFVKFFEHLLVLSQQRWI